jgi:hypothetical protein
VAMDHTAPDGTGFSMPRFQPQKPSGLAIFIQCLRDEGPSLRSLG